MVRTCTKPTLLIVEDEAGPRNALKVILRPFYNLLAVDNGHAAIRALKEGHVDLITLDMKLPDRPGMELLQEIKAEHGDVEVIIITGYGSLKSAMDAMRYGAAAYLLKPFNVTELLSVINETLAKRQRITGLRRALQALEGQWESEEPADLLWKHLEEEYYQNGEKGRPEARPVQGGTIAPLLPELLEAKSRDLLMHANRTSFYANLLGKHLDLNEADQRALTVGAFLHDLGQIGLPDHLVQRPGPLATSDVSILKRHPEIGGRIVSCLELPAEVRQIVLYHHEHFDGSGYPYGLQGEGIPRLARIVAICEAFDHLTAMRPQTSPITVPHAIEEMKRRAGREFDPALVEAFFRVASDSTTTLPERAASSKPTVISEF